MAAAIVEVSSTLGVIREEIIEGIIWGIQLTRPQTRPSSKEEGLGW